MENTNNNPFAEQGKTIAIIAYFTLVGWIIALVMHSSNKTSLGAYHLRQTLGLMIVAIALTVIRIPLMFIPFMGWWLNTAISVLILILWILGLVAAANSEEKPIPILGPLFQNWFSGIGK